MFMVLTTMFNTREVQLSSGWFNCTEPSLSTSLQGKDDLFNRDLNQILRAFVKHFVRAGRSSLKTIVSCWSETEAPSGN